MIYRLINWLTSNYGLSVIGLACPVLGFAFQLLGYPFGLQYETWLFLTAAFYIGLLFAIADYYYGLIRALAFTFPSCIVILAVLPVFAPGLLDWPVLLAGILFAGILEVVILKPEN